ncbi:MAG: insulinase family protein [Deltaproteobacteria bacterium]|nr:insulinase family protein [Deltaproteobacteria bacterium]
MLKTTLTVVLSLLASFAHAAATPSGEILTLPHKEVTLTNGVRVFMVKYPSPHVVAYELPVHVGSRNEVEEGKTGFAHFFEHLMFRGTKHLSGKAFGDLYTKLGCENNAWTSYDMTNYHGVVASDNLAKILEAEADRFINLEFSEKVLRDEAGAVLGEYNKDVAQPEFLLEEKLMATAFEKHPYSHTTMGYKDDVLKYTERYKDVWPFFRRYYRPSNVSIVLVGDVDFAKNLKDIETYFGAWKDPELAPSAIPVEPEQTSAREAQVKLDKPTQTRITVAYKVPAFTTKNTDVAALDLLAEMLFSVTSDFQKEFRFEKKWLDSVSASGNESVDPGIWTIGLRLSEAGEGKNAELIAAVERVIASVRDKQPDAERLAATKKRFRNAAITSWFGAPDSLADRIAIYTNFEHDVGVLNRMFERLGEVGPGTINEVAKRYLTDARKTTVTLSGTRGI